MPSPFREFNTLQEQYDATYWRYLAVMFVRIFSWVIDKEVWLVLLNEVSRVIVSLLILATLPVSLPLITFFIRRYNRRGIEKRYPQVKEKSSGSV